MRQFSVRPGCASKRRHFNSNSSVTHKIAPGNSLGTGSSASSLAVTASDDAVGAEELSQDCELNLAQGSIRVKGHLGAACNVDFREQRHDDVTMSCANCDEKLLESPLSPCRVRSPSGIRLLPRANPEQGRLSGLKLRRTDPDKPPKHSGEVAWVRKSRDSGSVQDAAPRITQRNLCPFDSLLQHIPVRCAAHASLEQLGKMVSAHACQFSQVGQADIFR